MFKDIDASTILSRVPFPIDGTVDCRIHGTIPDHAIIMGNGNIQFENMGDHCRISTLGSITGKNVGDFVIMDAQGDVNLRHIGQFGKVLADGDATIKHVTGSGFVQAANVAIDTAEDYCKFTSTSGDVHVTRAGKSLAIDAARRGFCLYPGENYELRRNLQLALPPAQYTLEERLEHAGIYQCAGDKQHYYVPKELQADSKRFPELYSFVEQLATQHKNSLGEKVGKKIKVSEHHIVNRAGELLDTACINRRTGEAGYVDSQVEKYLRRFEESQKNGGQSR